MKKKELLVGALLVSLVFMSPGVWIYLVLAAARVDDFVSDRGQAGILPDSRQIEADRIAQVVTHAISYPRQSSAAGYARAAADTRAADDGRLVVVEAREVRSDGPEDPSAHLVYRIHIPSSPSTGFGDSEDPALTICYDVDFNLTGAIGAPSRRECLADTSAVALPPAPLVMQIPVGSDAALSRSLRELPSDADGVRVRAAVLAALPPAPAGSLAPEVTAATAGGDVGVSVRSAAGHCLFGARFDGASGKVLVWRPSSVQLQPGELSCDPGTALHRGGIIPPH